MAATIKQTKFQVWVQNQMSEEHKFQYKVISFHFLEWYYGVVEDFSGTKLRIQSSAICVKIDSNCVLGCNIVFLVDFIPYDQTDKASTYCET